VTSATTKSQSLGRARARRSVLVASREERAQSEEMTAEQPPCPRCYSELPVVRPWAGFRVLRVVWLVGVCLVVLLAPILASDLLVMTPLSVVFLFGGGPILGFAKLRPSCAACGLERPHPGWHETPCRPVRIAEVRRVLRVTLPRLEASESDEPSGVHTRPNTDDS
jgi:hypothetical protein